MEKVSCALSPGRRLRKLLARDQILVAPGVYDGFSARVALEIGFDCLYMVGSSKFEPSKLMVVQDGCWNMCVEIRPT